MDNRLSLKSAQIKQFQIQTFNIILPNLIHQSKIRLRSCGSFGGQGKNLKK